MHNNAYWCRLSLALAMVAVLAISLPVGAAQEMEAPEASGVAIAAEPTDQEVLALFQEGIALYESGEFAQARKAFEQMLAMRPSSLAALEMRNQAEIGLFVKMQFEQEDEGLAEAAGEVIEIMTTAARQDKREIADVQALLEDF